MTSPLYVVIGGYTMECYLSDKLLDIAPYPDKALYNMLTFTHLATPRSPLLRWAGKVVLDRRSEGTKEYPLLVKWAGVNLPDVEIIFKDMKFCSGESEDDEWKEDIEREYLYFRPYVKCACIDVVFQAVAPGSRLYKLKAVYVESKKATYNKAKGARKRLKREPKYES
jgi:hypothetical protein